jgi:adenylate kinase
MFKFNIIFIAGTHGVGKGYLCKQISTELDLLTYSASALIKGEKKSAVDSAKRVIDPDSNQNHLVSALQKLKISSKTIIIDGHFCLFDGASIIEIGIDIFKSMPLKGIIILYDEPIKIFERMQNRDGESLNIEIIQELQRKEIGHGKKIAEALNLPLLTITSSESENAINWIKLQNNA